MKKQLLTIIMLAFIGWSNVANAQAPNWAWAKSAGGTWDDRGNSIATDASGNVFMTGSFSSPTITFGTTTLTNNGNNDIFIVKYDANGNALWAKSAGGADNEWGYSVATDAAGNTYITGAFASSTITFGATTLTNSSSVGNSDIFIVKYDANGNALWAKSAGGTWDDVGNSIATDAAGNAYITGGFSSPAITFGTTTLTNSGDYDIFIAKYDTNGNVIWAKSAGGTDADGGIGIVTDVAGNAYITGEFASSTITFGATTLTNSSSVGNSDIFIVKYDANGNALWAKSAGGADYEWGCSVATDAAGNAYITGAFYSSTITFGTTSLTNYGIGNIFIAKYDSNGNVLWAKSVGGPVDDWGNSIATDASGNVFMTGSFSSPTITFGATTLTNSSSVSNYDIFIVKYDANGNVIWAKSAGGWYSAGSNSIATDAAGNAYITGTFTSPAITFGATTLTNNGNENIFIAKVEPFAIILAQTNVLCYGGITGSITVNVYGANGTCQYSKDGGITYQSSNVFTGLGSGTYAIVVKDANNCVTTAQTVTITQPASLPSFTYTSTNALCNGANTGSITVTATGGTGTKQYSQNGGVSYQTSNVFNGLFAGSYQIIVKDANNCVAPAQTVFITEPASLPSFTYTSTNIITCNGANTGIITATAAGGTLPYQYSINGGNSYQSSNIFNSLYAGTYQIAVKDTNGCVTPSQGVTIIQPTAIAPVLSHSNVGCLGGINGSATVSATGGTGTLTYNWQPYGGTDSTATNLSAGTYTVTITDNNSCSETATVTITQPSVALSIDYSYIINTSCGTSLGSISVFPSGGTLNYNYLWSNGDTTNFNQNLPVGNYSVVVTDANGCVVTSPILTVGTNLINTIPLCMVTVDSSSAHNIIVWEKTGLPSTIDSFRIYRETMTNVYTHIGSVSMDSLSEFHDYGANPNVTSYKYKLGAIDICNDTAVALSDYHNSIHLQYLGFGNLAWSLYQIENAANPVNFYIISRDDTGTGNFLPISSTIPGGNNSYTDVNYASYPNARYRVDVTWNISCNPTRTVTTTHSNVIHLGTSVSVSEVEQNNAVSISPNPFTNSTTITFANEQKNTSVKVMNVLGECIQQLTTNNKQFTLDLSSFAKGIYFVRIEDENKNVVNKKIVKE